MLGLSGAVVGSILSGIEQPQYKLASANGLKPQASSSPVGNTPSKIRTAYGFNQITFNGGVVGDGSGQTIAIIDAYDAPTIVNDLHVFDTAFGLPDPPSFKRVAQNGSTNYPTTDPMGSPGAGDDTWEIETVLDVESAHALAPGANILLVEANSDSNFDLIQSAVNYARSQPGVAAVSMSFSGSEFSSETSLDTYFTTPSDHGGVTFLAATGDTGKPSGYPALSPNVVAVGGTTLSIDGSGDYLSETGWSGSGGSVSKYESQPSYQSSIVTQSSTLRTNPDVAFDADPNSGVAIYDSYDFGTAGWIQVGGTSFATPAWAALVAVADQGRSLAGLTSLDGHAQTLPMLYQLPSGDFHDITSGNNGFAAGPGYDLVTGLGSPQANLIVGSLLGSSLSGVVFNDANSDGVQDNGETGLAGVTVFDDLNNNGVLDGPAQATVPSTNVPVPIPDVTTITSSLDISGLTGTIGDVNVTLNITHTYDSDLVITLISPTGTQVTLASQNGRSGDNFSNTTFDDQASTSISSGRAPFSGTYRPIGSLATLNGQDPNGKWTLQVADVAPLDSGTLNSWSVQISTVGEQSVTTAADGSYAFLNVTPGTHHLREIVPANSVETLPGSDIYDVTTAIGSNVGNLNFGNGPVQAVVVPPAQGDFDGDGKLTAADISAMMLALTDYQSYAATYASAIPPDQLLAKGDLNGDGAFNNLDLQSLISAVANAAPAVVSPAAAATVSPKAVSVSSVLPKVLSAATLPSPTSSTAHRPSVVDQLLRSTRHSHSQRVTLILDELLARWG